MKTMQPLEDMPDEARLRVRGVLTDIDDTLTTDGTLTAAAYAAMERLQGTGLLVVPITGRPAGWCDHIARMWPVDGVVGENGAFYFHYDREARRMTRRFLDDEAARADKRARLERIADEVLAEVPGAAIAADQPYRETDLAIDFREDVAPLAPEAVARIVAVFERHGATAKVSSIHVNGWFGTYDKLETTRLFMSEVFSLDLDAQRADYVFVGDSPNDVPMFGFFPHAVGVANFRSFADQCAEHPAWITHAEAGAGFVEVAEALLRVSPDVSPG
jgi:HAD superfamily hydrolase (TIGR01484 family)